MSITQFSFSASVVCPYYIRESKKSITCEGFTEDTDLSTLFADQCGKQAFQVGRCDMFDYEDRCPLAAALAKKYAGEK